MDIEREKQKMSLPMRVEVDRLECMGWVLQGYYYNQGNEGGGYATMTKNGKIVEVYPIGNSLSF